MSMDGEDRIKLFEKYWKVRNRAHREKSFGKDTLTGRLIKNLDRVFYEDDLAIWDEMSAEKKEKVIAMACAYNHAGWCDDGSENRHWKPFAAACGPASRTIYNKLKREGLLPRYHP